MDDKSQSTVPPLSSLKIVVDHSIPTDELRVHPAMFDVLQRAFHEADNERFNRDYLERYQP
jgi:hypothetical protein